MLTGYRVMALALKVEHLFKKYQRGTINHRWAIWRIKNFFVSKQRSKTSEKNEMYGSFYALNDVSFDVAQGEAVGIVGTNGAGKTTLLKILSRITAPSAGIVKINGRIASLLDLAAGFHPELTGRENIFLIGAFLGLNRRILEEKLDSIISFAELEFLIDTPIKRYSAGMYLRLAISVAVNLDNDIILLDEVFAVADVGFQEKCIASINEMVKTKKKTLLVVSHNRELIDSICSRVIVLEKGCIVETSPPTSIHENGRN